MIPEKLILENFLSYSGSTEIDFTGFHSAVIVGENGAGKSSILDGITYSLFGVARGTSRSGDNSDRLISGNNDFLKVELMFKVEDTSYRVIRKRNRIKQISELELYKFDQNNKWKSITGSTLKMTQDAIISLLKVNYDLFVSSVMVMQGKADSFTCKDPSERKDLLGEILGLQIYEELRELASQKRKVITLNIKSMQMFLESAKDKINKKKLIEDELEKLNVLTLEKETEIKQIKEKLNTILHNLKKIEINSLNKKNLTERLEKEKKNLESLTEEKQSYSEKIEEANKIIMMQNEIETGYQNLVSYVARDKKMTEDFENRTRIDKEIEELKTKITEEEHIIKLKQAELEKEKNIYLHEKSKFMTVNLKIQTLQGELKELDRIRAKKDEIEEKLNSLKVEYAKLEQNLNDSNKKLEEIRKKKKEIEDKLSYIEDILREEHSLNEQIKTIKENKAKLEILKTDTANETLKINQLELIIKDSETVIENTNQRLLVMKQEGGIKRCPVCGTPLNEERKTELTISYKKELDQKLDLIKANKSKINEINISLIEKLKTKDFLELSTLRESELIEKKVILTNGKDQKTILRDELLTAKTGETHFQDDIARLTNKIIDIRSTLATAEKQHTEYLYKLSMENNIHTSLGELLEQLNKAKEAEERLPLITHSLIGISRKLETKDYASAPRKRLEEIEKKLFEYPYNPLLHKELKQKIESFIYLERQKKLLDEKINEKQLLSNSINSINEKSDNAKREINEILENLNLINSDDDDTGFENLSNQKNQYTDTLEKLTEERESILKLQASAITNISNCREIEEEYYNKNEDVTKLLKEENILSKAIDIFSKNGIQSFIIENVIPEIEEKANQILDIISDGRLQVYFRVQSKTKKGNMKETLDIDISNDGEIRSYELFSGGEKFKVDIAIRVSLSYVLANKSGAKLSMLIIDEGFGTQDKEGILKFIECINKISDEFQKVIIVTHMDDLKDYFETKIRVIKENSISKIILE